MGHFITSEQADRQEIVEWGQEDGVEHSLSFRNLSLQEVEQAAENEAAMRLEDHTADDRDDFIKLYKEAFVEAYFA